MGGLAALAREAGHTRDRLRRQRLSADERPAARARHRADRGLRRRPARARRPTCSSIGNVDHARQPADGGDPRRRRCPTPAARNGWPTTCCRAATCSRSPARTARPRRPSMLAWILEQAGLEPGFLIGGVPLQLRRLGAARRAPQAPFVIEADEYDTAFFDKRSKFVHYRPRTAILNNLEFDHADIFDDLAAIERQFHHLVRTVPAQRPAGRQRARRERCSACSRWAAGATVQRFGARKEEPGALRARGEPHAFDVLRGSLKIGARRMGAARRAQPAQCARRDRRRRACRRRARRRGAGARRRSRTCGAGSSCAATVDGVDGLRRFRAPPDGDPHDDQRAAPHEVGARSASSRCSSRARTR